MDHIVHIEARKLGFIVVTVNAEWKRYGPAAGPKRNERMIKEHPPTMVYLFHDHIELSKGTKNMRRLCIKHKIPYEVRKSK